MPARRAIWKYAAAIALPLGIAIAALWLNAPETQPVAQNQMGQNAKTRSAQTGRQKAMLVLPDGKQIPVTAEQAKPLQELPETTSPASAPTQAGKGQAEKENALVTYKDSEYWVTFDDGTIVHLNYNTTLKYPTRFGEHDRTVYLDGEGYFQVSKDAKRPFRVVTADGVVKQYGTTFNVNTHAGEGNHTQVVLVEGSIAVSTHGGEERMLRPGDCAVLPTAGPIEVSQVDIAPYVAWDSGHFAFDNCTLEQLMQVLSHWYDRKVRFESEAAKQQRFTGDLDRYSPIGDVLDAIQRVTSVDIEMQEGEIIVRETSY